MADFVLVHGGFHDGRAWSTTIKELVGQGHRAVAPTLAGHGFDVPRNVTLDDQARSVTQAIDDAGFDRVILVGHSYAGCVIQRVAEQIPQQVGSLVFLQARVVEPGTSIMDCLPAGFITALDIARGELRVPTYEQFVEAFVGSGVDEHVAAQAYAHLSPTPTAPSTEVLPLETFFDLDIPITVVWSRDDASMPDGFRSHPDQSRRLRNARVIEIAGGHEPMFVDPIGLAKVLDTIA